MEWGLGELAVGIRVAGALHAGLLAAYSAVSLRPLRTAGIPLFYGLCLAAALIEPLLVGEGLELLRVVVWTFSVSLAAATYLLVLQLMSGDLPEREHFYILIFPGLAIPGIYTASFIGNQEICPAALEACVPLAPLVGLYKIVAGLVVLLVLLIVKNRALPSLRARPLGRERYVLILSIVMVHVLMLGLDLGGLAGLLRAAGSDFAGAVVQITMIYLVGSALFRLPSGNGAPLAAEGAVANGTVPAQEAERAKAELSDSDRELLRRIEALMRLDKLYQEPAYSRRQLADELGVPEHHVTRAINLGLGKSFTELVNEHRVAEAKALLTGSEQPISQIAFDVGFNSLASFNRVFKACTGTSPTEHRRAPGA